MKSIIIYATKYGTAAKAAEMLKARMEGDVRLINIMKEIVPPLAGYDTVILGGSIYAGKVQKELLEYVHANLPLLLRKRVGLFICAGDPDEKVREEEHQNAFPPELHEHAAAREVFGYEFHLDQLHFFDKFLLRMVKGVKEDVSALSEEKINHFAEVMAAK
ncbi:MAG: flavodoxin domain-containing protein [Ectobacillus sp.]